MFFLLGLATSAAYWPGLASAAYAPRWWAVLILAPLCLSDVRRTPLSTGHWLGLTCLAVAALSQFWSFSPPDTTYHLVLLAALGCAFAAATGLDSLLPFWRGTALGLVPSLVVALLQLSGHNPVPSFGIDGLFLNRNVFAAVGLVAALGLLEDGIPQRRLDQALFAVALACFILAGSRSAYLAGAVVGLLWLLPQLTWPARVNLVAAVVLVTAGLLLLDDVYGTGRHESMLYRTHFWRLTLANLSWLGTGFGTYPEVWAYGDAHNEALQLVFELGALSLPFFALTGYALFSADFAADRAALGALLITSLFNANLHAPTPAIMAALLLGHMCGARRRVLDLGAVSRAWRAKRVPLGAAAWRSGHLRHAGAGS